MSDYEDATELEFDGSLAQQDPFSSSQATERFSLGGDTTIGAGDTTVIAPISSSDDEAEAEGATGAAGDEGEAEGTTGAAGGEGGESGAGAHEAAGASVAGDTVARTIRDASASDANTVDPPEDPAAEAMDEIPSDDDSRHEDDDEETEVQGAPGHVALLLSQHLSASTSSSASTGGGTVASRVKDIRAIIDANHRSDKTNLRLDKSGGLSLSQSSDASSSSSHQSQTSPRKRAAALGAAALVQGQSDARLVALLRTAVDLATAAAADDALRHPSGAPPPPFPPSPASSRPSSPPSPAVPAPRGAAGAAPPRAASSSTPPPSTSSSPPHPHPPTTPRAGQAATRRWGGVGMTGRGGCRTSCAARSSRSLSPISTSSPPPTSSRSSSAASAPSGP